MLLPGKHEINSLRRFSTPSFLDKTDLTDEVRKLGTAARDVSREQSLEALEATEPG
jgi:hypothetical protein